MGAFKTILCTSLGSILIIILTSCQNYAVEDTSEKVKEIKAIEEEREDKLKTSSLESTTDDVVEDEVNKQDDHLLPKIAPATPVSSSFILVSRSEREEALHHSLTIEHQPDHFESIKKEKRPIDNSQIDEVEFDSELLAKKDVDNSVPSDEEKAKDMLNQKVRQPEGPGDDNKDASKLQQANIEELVIDLMKYEVRDKEAVTDNNSGGSQADSTVSNNLEPVMVETDVKINHEKDPVSDETLEKKLTKANEMPESDVPDKGILESFKDWKEKQETNGKKEDVEKSVVRVSIKKRGNKKTNYASSECGAKVIAANPEAENTGAILNENRDFYMLNPCSCNIWFVIELCEKVSAETIEVANFELFSSTMENFKVYFSTRYPTREWEYGGLLQGKAERTVQSYNMAEEYYAKFVKIEILSHFGKEHYCPLSLVRVFGRSEVEELDDSEDSSHEHDETETSTSSNHKETQNQIKNSGDENEKKNFLKSATDMVIGLVNKATQSFTGSDGKSNDTGSLVNDSNSLGLSKELSSDEKQSEGSGSLKVAPKVIQINDDSADVLNTSELASKHGEEKEKSRENSPGTVSSPNLVILLDRDDTEEEADSSSQSKLCIFNGEIDFQRCANPIRQFWILYLFVFRMCPLLSENLLDSRNITGTRQSTQAVNDSSKFNISVNILNITTSEVTSQSGETIKQQKLAVTVTSSGVEHRFMRGTSFHSFSSPVSSIIDNKDEKMETNENHLLSPSRSEKESGGVSGVTAAELMEHKNSEEIIACEKRSPKQPDLSQLLSVAISLKKEESRSDKEKLESSVNVDTSTSTYEPEDRWPKEKGKIEHVDVLVIKYDENLGEGKAEVPPVDTNINEAAETSEKTGKLKDAVSKDLKGETVVDDVDKTKSMLEMSAQRTEETASVASLKVPLEEGLQSRSAPSESISSTEKTRLVDEDGDKIKLLEDFPEKPKEPWQSVNVLPKEVLEDHSAISHASESRQNTSLPTIKPSFSEPVHASSGSGKTQSATDYEGVEVIITDSDLGASLNPASVLKSSSTSEHDKVSATRRSGEHEVNNQVDASNEKVPDIREDLRTSVEQFEKQKKEAMETLTQIESSIKIGSGSSSNNKESAILKLKSKVKELASNLSLSTLYLEEMSKRYGTALEEQQKQFKAKISLLNQTIAKNREVVDQQQKLIEELTKQVMILTLRLQNLTDVTREHNLQMTERYAFTCMIEAFIIIIVLYTCIRAPRVVQQPIEQRRHSAPSTYNHVIHQGNNLDLNSRNIDSITDQRPSDISILSHVDGNIPVNSAYSAIAKRRRQRKKRFPEGSFCNELDQGDASSAKEAAMMSSTAGVLFSAGKGIFTGLTGAFSKQKKSIASRQTRALIDSTEDERVKSLGRSKSLSTIEEDDIVLSPRRHQSYENIRSTKYKKALTRFSDSDKRRG